MTLPMPLWDGTQDGLQYILDLLAQSVTDTGGQEVRMRFGAGTYSLAAITATSNTVTHGLGKTPVVAFVLTDDHTLVTGVDSFSSTSLRAKFHTYDNVARTQTGPFYWLAIA